MRRRVTAVLACWAAAGCSDAESVEVQPLPPLERPSMEARAGLPEVAGVWRFAGFEILAGDTAAVRNRVYPMTPPGELAIETQRLDSIAGRYLREGTAFPFSGEVRRDGTFALVAFAGGEGSFAAGRLARDTLWLELTSFAVADGWPQGSRAGLVRRPSGAPFLRLVGGSPIGAPVDSAAMADSARLEALRRAGEAPPAGVPPGVGTPPAAPAEPRRPQPAEPERPQPDEPRPPRAEPQRPAPERPDTPRREPDPAPPRQPPPDTPRQPPPDTPRQPVTPPPPPPPVDEPAEPPPAAPRDTIRFGVPR